MQIPEFCSSLFQTKLNQSKQNKYTDQEKKSPFFHSLVYFSCCYYLVTKSYTTLCNPMGCRVHGIVQARYWRGQPFPSPAGTEAAPRARVPSGSPLSELHSWPCTDLSEPDSRHGTGVTAAPLQSVLRTGSTQPHSGARPAQSSAA